MSRRDEVYKSFIQYKDETDDRVKCGIEQNRKGYFKITAKDKNGNVLPNIKITAKQKNHEFLHGANIFMLDELETAEKNKIYHDSFKEIFNQATLPFYWDALEPVEGKPRFEKDSPKVYRRPAPDLCLEYCEENGITPKEHCLTYFSFQPDWVDKYDIEDMKKKLEIRYQMLAERYSARIHCWEVINELFCTRPELNENRFFVADDVLDWNFKLAEKYFPQNELVINEAGWIWEWVHFAFSRSGYYQMIDQALKRGLRIDAVGMQYHAFVAKENEKEKADSMYNPKTIFTVLDTYEKLGKPIQITEITIPCYSDSKEDEELQADILEQLYNIWFSHKSVEMITYWNLVDGYAAFAPQGDMKNGENRYYGGLMRFDLSKKPSFDRIYSLFNEKWITNAEIQTDEHGAANFKGFFGTYELNIDGKKFEIKTKKGGNNEFEIVL